jgi:hypothetical protein
VYHHHHHHLITNVYATRTIHHYLICLTFITSLLHYCTDTTLNVTICHF